MTKLNPAADESGKFVSLPIDATLFEGETVKTTNGGIVVEGDNYYSYARPEAVPAGTESLMMAGQGMVLQSRLAPISIQEHPKSVRTKFGGELEVVKLDADGNYTPDTDLKELYTFMIEGKTEPTADTEELAQNYRSLITQLVAKAAAEGVFISANSVVGQRELLPSEQNPKSYITHVADWMEGLTGFSPRLAFAVAGTQPHTSISNTAAALVAAEAMQYLNPILMAPSLDGPFLENGFIASLDPGQLTEKQDAHLQRVEVYQRNLLRPHQSYRYPLRRIGSPAAGIWFEPAPNTLYDYLLDGHWGLATGRDNNIDRFRGPHTDRIRSVLDGKGASTFESSAFDAFMGNHEALTANHLLVSGLFTALEAIAIYKQDPRMLVAKVLGIRNQTPVKRLELAHQYSLTVSEKGNDAFLYCGKQPRQWLPQLLKLAEYAPYIGLSEDHKLRLDRMYAPTADARKEAEKWHVEHGVNSPVAQAYFARTVGSPAVYRQVQFEVLQERHPSWPRSELIRMTDLMTAQALHTSVGV